MEFNDFLGFNYIPLKVHLVNSFKIVKKIPCIILILITVSCSSKKEVYTVFNNLFDNEIDYKLYGKKVEIIPNINDTILLSDKSISPKDISHFSLHFESLKEKKPFYSGYRVFWADSLNEISLSQTEISFIRNQMNEEYFYFERNRIDKKNRIVINIDSIYTPDYKYSYESSKKEYLIYHFSKPCFNQKKDICVIGFYTNSSARKCCGSKMILLILKKDNKNWNVIGYQKDVGSSH